ncbi:alginate O-acetyltransferase AlgX-related protein [Phaeobacter marinintestinus]|uniref:alginate O-acetyltransferase AlgX-related protein n=1 Tax=Falsiphaeobacter marinintestinus TaxID=1492905 RepID=UPI0011B4BFF5|nr:GDSL-type esterase/lipase family protein [Phaeobacter marinintestinus]
MSWTDPKHRRMVCVGLAAASALLGVAVLMTTASPSKVEGALFGLWRLRHVLVALVLILAALSFARLARSRTALLSLWAAILPVTFFCIALELLGRFGVVDWTTLLMPPKAPGESIGWSLQPNVDVKGETGQDIAARLKLPHDPIPFAFSTDDHGFRNGQEAQGEVIILGDSIVLGAAVPFEQTVAEVIEDDLGIPVMQAALLGLSIQAEHDMIAQADLPLEGKTVVQLLFEGNDLLDSKTYRRQATQQPSATDTTGVSIANLMWSKLVDLSNPPAKYHTCQIGDQTYAFLWTRQSFDGVEGEFDEITQAIEDFRAMLNDKGADYRLVFVPSKYRVLESLCVFPPDSAISNRNDNLSDLPDRLPQWAATHDVSFLDLTDPLKSQAESGEIPWFWGDTHWNASGHEIAGQKIANWLKGLGN